MSAAPNFDWRVVLLTPLRFLAPWVAMVAVVTLAGYPGVICATPLAWLLALWVGLVVVQSSASPDAGQRLREAALAGALYGLLQGILFGGLVLHAFPLQPAEHSQAAVLIVVVVTLGIVAGAGLALFNGYLAVLRQRRANS